MGRTLKFRRRRRLPLALVAILGLALGAELGLAFDISPADVGQLWTRIQTSAATQAPSSTQTGRTAYFGFCYSGPGINCVVDGDTFWADGRRIRVADIDAPETHPPRCAYEANLGERATIRLRQLLNQGPFELERMGRDHDIYGRKLRIVIRDGHSLGQQLVAEGLARVWAGTRRPWC